MNTNDARGKTIMVVDDTEDIRELMRLQLTTLGYWVVEAANGQEAVEAVSNECPALILMDLTMPVLDGLEATRLIRQTAGVCDVVIVAFTALASGGKRREALAAGCDDFMEKPVGIEKLAALLDRHLKGRHLISMNSHLARQMSGLRHGDHTCLVYESEEEQLRALVPFIAEGLRRGECCYFTGNERSIGQVASALRGAGVEADREQKRGALSLSTPKESYLKTGRFDMEEQFGQFAAMIDQVRGDGFGGLRHAGQMDWAIEHEQDPETLIEYEAKLNDIVPGLRLTGLCQYDRRRFPSEIIRDAIRTHPVVVLRDEVCPNHLYEPPELFLNGHSAERRVQWMMRQLNGTKRVESSKPTVLVVDDDQFIRAQMKQSVETMGYRAVKAEDEGEMIEKARRERPDLILTNTDLRWLDRLISLLRGDEELRFLPVAAVYPNPPEDFQKERLVVLDGYENLHSILPPDGSPS